MTEVTLYRITRPHYGERPACVTNAKTGGRIVLKSEMKDHDNMK